MGYSVLLSNYRRYFSLASYLSTFSKESIVISMGIPSVRVSACFDSPALCSPNCHKHQKEKRRKDYAYWRHFNEKPSIMAGCTSHKHHSPSVL